MIGRFHFDFELFLSRILSIQFDLRRSIIGFAPNTTGGGGEQSLTNANSFPVLGSIRKTGLLFRYLFRTISYVILALGVLGSSLSVAVMVIT